MTNDKKTKCSSCNVDITNMNGSIEFNCPNCGKVRIVRCGECRDKAIKYKCSECGFEGPN